MLSKKYLNSVKNIDSILKKIVEGTAPERFSTDHLKKIGFSSSNDRAFIGVLKDLGFLTDNGEPTGLYHEFRNAAKSAHVLGEALRVAYSEIFHLSENPSVENKREIVGLFKSTHNVSNQVAGFMANTFLSLLTHADLSMNVKKTEESESSKKKVAQDNSKSTKPTEEKQANTIFTPQLRYNIEVHLPATKDIEVYNSIFKSLKEHLLSE